MDNVRINPRNLFLAIWDQGPLLKALKNFFVTGVAWGLLSRNSHISYSSGKPKVPYSQKSAKRAAIRMEEKHGNKFSAYKCAFCDHYHIGVSRTRKQAHGRDQTRKSGNL